MIEIYISLALLAASLIAIVYFHYLSADKKISLTDIKVLARSIFTNIKSRGLIIFQKSLAGFKKLLPKVISVIPLVVAKSKDFVKTISVKFHKIDLAKIKELKIPRFQVKLPKIQMPKITLDKFRLFLPKPRKKETSDFLKKLLDFKEKNTIQTQPSQKLDLERTQLKESEKKIKASLQMSEETFQQVEKHWIEAIIKDSKDIVAYKKLAKLYYLHKDYGYCQEILDTLRKIGAKDPFIDKYQKKLNEKLKST